MDKRFFFLINMAQHRMFKFADVQCKERLGLSVTQATALIFIAKNEGCLQKELAAVVGQNQSAITGLIGRMQKNDLIDRRACEDDGRASRLYLSAEGQSKLLEVFPLIKELNHKISAQFSDEELETVARFLNVMIEDFRH